MKMDLLHGGPVYLTLRLPDLPVDLRRIPAHLLTHRKGPNPLQDLGIAGVVVMVLMALMWFVAIPMLMAVPVPMFFFLPLHFHMHLDPADPRFSDHRADRDLPV